MPVVGGAKIGETKMGFSTDVEVMRQKVGNTPFHEGFYNDLGLTIRLQGKYGNAEILHNLNIIRHG